MCGWLVVVPGQVLGVLGGGDCVEESAGFGGEAGRAASFGDGGEAGYFVACPGEGGGFGGEGE